MDFYRTRPYKKNDNARVEQKNWTHMRQLLEYERFDRPEMVPLINDLYKTWSLYQNHFMPTFKLIEKTKIGSKYRKKYEKPATSCRRLLECGRMEEEAKRKLLSVHATLNPFSLKKEIERKSRKVFNAIKTPKHETMTLGQNSAPFGYLFP